MSLWADAEIKKLIARVNELEERINAMAPFPRVSTPPFQPLQEAVERAQKLRKQ